MHFVSLAFKISLFFDRHGWRALSTATTWFVKPCTRAFESKVASDRGWLWTGCDHIVWITTWVGLSREHMSWGHRQDVLLWCVPAWERLKMSELEIFFRSLRLYYLRPTSWSKESPLPGGFSLLATGGFQIKNPEEEDHTWRNTPKINQTPPKLINFGHGSVSSIPCSQKTR